MVYGFIWFWCVLWLLVGVCDGGSVPGRVGCGYLCLGLMGLRVLFGFLVVRFGWVCVVAWRLGFLWVGII